MAAGHQLFIIFWSTTSIAPTILLFIVEKLTDACTALEIKIKVVFPQRVLPQILP
jgi:hypothetical protein